MYSGEGVTVISLHPIFGQLQQFLLLFFTKECVINTNAHHRFGLFDGEDACIIESLEFIGDSGVRNSHVVGIDANGNAIRKECLKGILRYGGNAFDSLGAALVAIAMLYVDRKKSYGLQLPNIQK